MRLENLLRGMTLPGAVPHKRKENIRKQLSQDEKTVFVVQNLVGEIVRLEKQLQRSKGHSLYSDQMQSLNIIDQSAIANAWGVSRTVFPNLLAKIQKIGSLKRQSGTGMTLQL